MTVDTGRTTRLDSSHRGFVGPVRLARHTQQHEVLALTADLVHLETQARVPADLDLTWLAPALAQPGFDLVTASVEGRLVGYVAGNLGVDLTLTRLVVAAHALEAHPEIPALLLDAILTHEDRPWADIVAPTGFAALPVLLAQGWEVAPAPRGDGDVDGIATVRLSAARDYYDG